MKIEYASLYNHWYTMMDKTMQKKGAMPPEVLIEIKEKVENLTDDIDQEVFEKHGITEDLLNLMREKYEEDPKVAEMVKSMISNYELLFSFKKP